MTDHTAKPKTPEEIDYEHRAQLLQKEIRPLCEKHRIDIRGTLRVTPQGIIPGVAFVDMKEHYEHTVTPIKE